MLWLAAQDVHDVTTVEDPHVLTLVQQIFAHIAPDGSLAPDPPTKRWAARENAARVRHGAERGPQFQSGFR